MARRSGTVTLNLEIRRLLLFCMGLKNVVYTKGGT